MVAGVLDLDVLFAARLEANEHVRQIGGLRPDLGRRDLADRIVAGRHSALRVASQASNRPCGPAPTSVEGPGGAALVCRAQASGKGRGATDTPA